jgi:polyhydroxyalkanoate synthase subunit PhaC
MDHRLAYLQPAQPDSTEPHASAWQGLMDSDDPEQALASAHWDKLLNAALGAVTAHISPAAVALAMTDWLFHLSLSPSRRELLVMKAWKKYWRWMALVQTHGAPCCIEPLPQDKRFADPAWQRWPYNLIYQGFLLQQQWWHVTTTGVPGMSQHHEDVVSFITRQLLDMVAPSNFILTNPVVQEVTMRRGGMNLLQGFMRLCGELAWRPPSRHAGQDPASPVGVSVAVTPGKVVYRNHLIELIRYTPQGGAVRAIPLLFVPAWIMKYYILDLSPSNSLVKYLVERGYDVYMISWRNPDAADRELSMDDYRRLGIMDALDAIEADCGATRVNAAGYCLGGTLLGIAAAAMARDGDQRLNSVTLFASQLDFKEPGELSLFVDDSEVSYLEACMWNQGYLDTTQMAGAFQLLRSNDLIWSRRLRDYLLDLPERNTDLMAWNADATRMPYRMHSQYLRSLFLHNDLSEGRYCAGGRPVALSDIRAPVFCVATIKDHVAPWRSVYKLHRLLHTEIDFVLTSGGHNVGVVSPPGTLGRHYRQASHSPQQPSVDPDTWYAGTPVRQGSWWPAWHAWLANHSGPDIAPVDSRSAPLCDAPGTYVHQR